MLGVNLRDSVFVRLNERDPLLRPRSLAAYESGPLQVFAVVRNYTTHRGSVTVKVIKYNQKVLAKERIR